MTQRRSLVDFQTGLAAGGNDFILKPFDEKQLLDRVSHWSGRTVLPEHSAKARAAVAEIDDARRAQTVVAATEDVATAPSGDWRIKSGRPESHPVIDFLLLAAAQNPGLKLSDAWAQAAKNPKLQPEFFKNWSDVIERFVSVYGDLRVRDLSDRDGKALLAATGWRKATPAESLTEREFDV